MTLKFAGNAVLLEGGPRDGWAYFVEEIERLVELERYWGREFPYVATDPERYVVHPRTDGKINSLVWVFVDPAERVGKQGPPPAVESPAAVPASPGAEGGPSKVDDVRAAIRGAGELGATPREITAATGHPGVQSAPIIGWLMVRGEIAAGGRRDGQQVWCAA